MELGRTFTRSMAWTAGRIIMGLLLAGVVAYFGTGTAKAHITPSGCSDQGTQTCDEGRAYLDAKTPANQTAHCVAAFGYTGGVHTAGPVSAPVKTGTTSGNYRVTFNCLKNGTLYQASAESYYFVKSCSTRAPLGGLYQSNFSGGSANICNYGCVYSQTTKQSDTTITDSGSPATSIRFGILFGGTPTGATCTNPDGSDKPKVKGEEPPPCLQIGSDSAGAIMHCPKEEGGSCITTGRGTKFCQPAPPNTDGPKVDTGRQEGISQSTSPNTQPQAPAPRTGEGFAPVASSTVTDNSTNSTSNSTVYAQTGTPNVNGSKVPGDGSGTGGAGQQETGGGTPLNGTTGTDMGPTNALLGEGNANTGAIKSAIEGIKGWWDGLGDEAGTLDDSKGEDLTTDETWQEEEEAVDLDAQGYGYGSSCPTPPQIDVPGGGQLDWSLLCTMAGYFGMLILAAGYVQAAFVIGGS